MNEKILKEKMIRHGEVLLVPIEVLPSDATESETTDSLIVAHSETGHNHVVVGDITNFKEFNSAKLREQLSELLYPNAEIAGLFRVNNPSILEHQKSFDKHETKDLSKGIYIIVIKKAYDYFKKALERVKD